MVTDNKPAQNLQDTFLNTIRKDRTPVTIYLVSGVKLAGRIRSFGKFCVLLESNNQKQLIFKHAISTVVSNPAAKDSGFRSTEPEASILPDVPFPPLDTLKPKPVKS